MAERLRSDHAAFRMCWLRPATHPLHILSLVSYADSPYGLLVAPRGRSLVNPCNSDVTMGGVQMSEDAVKEMCSKYSAAVNAGDADTYSKLFEDDAIWMPPGAPTRIGALEIKKAEAADYEQERLSVQFAPGDSLAIAENWIYGIAHVDGIGTTIDSGKQRSFRFTVAWLLHRQPGGTWKIKRQMWNHKPKEG